MIEETNGIYRVTAPSPLADGITILLLVLGLIVLGIGIFDDPVMWILVAAGVASKGGVCAASVLMI